MAGDDRPDGDDQQRHGDHHADHRLEPGGAQDAAMLDGEAEQQQDHAQEEGGIDPQRQPLVDEAEIGDGPLPGQDRGIGGEESRQHIARGDAGADGEHRRPGEPVAPDRERPEDLAVVDPGRGAVDGCTPGFVGEHAGDLGIGEGLGEAHEDGKRPDDIGRRADGGRDAADGEQHQGRHAAGDPEGLFPVDGAMQRPLANRLGHHAHVSAPLILTRPRRFISPAASNENRPARWRGRR